MIDEEFDLDSAPHAPPNMIVKAVEEAYFLLDPNTPNWMVVNAVGKDIVALCDGSRSVREIVKTLCEKYREPYEESCEGVLAFVNEAKGNRFLRRDPFPPLQRLNREEIPLNTLWLNVTNKCNLRCIHCHLDSGAPLENEMTTAEMCRAVSEAKEMGMKELVISGGEPLLRDDVSDIIKFACEQDIGKVSLVTNGTLITADTADMLTKFGVDVQVSLDGARKDTHDFIRGKGTYERTVKGMEHLISAGAQFHIGMTIMKPNIAELQEMAELTKRLGHDMLHYVVLQDKGRAKENLELIGLSDEDYVAAIKRMEDISSSTDVKITVEGALRMKVEQASRIDLCGAGGSIISVAADGNVYPCAGLHEKEFLAGSIRDQNLKTIWKESEIFKEFRSSSVLDIEECRDCELKFICGGGCRVDKYHTYGRLDVPSVRCRAEKEIYWHFLSEKIEEVMKTSRT